MGKRKAIASSDNEEEVKSNSSQEVSASETDSDPKAKGKNKSTRKIKRPTIESGSSNFEQAPHPKRSKPAQPKKTDTFAEKTSSTKVLMSKEGDKYIDLGKKKRATVRAFKGITYLDIREYYDAGGEEKPGKKGVSLTLEQWNVLKQITSQIDHLFTSVKK